MQPPQGYGPPPMPAHHPQGPPYAQYGPPQMPGYQAQGHPHPLYAPPQQRFQPPPKKSNLKWILGVTTVLVAVLLFAGCTTVVNGLNEGGNHQKKARTMMTMADTLPEEDWQLLARFDPKVEQGCLSIDIECVRLSATWLVPHQVTTEEAASRLGVDCSDAARTSKGCPRENSAEGITARVHVYPAGDAPGSWKVTIDLRAK